MGRTPRLAALAAIPLLLAPQAAAYCNLQRRLQSTSTATSACTRPLDLIYLLDQSGSIGADNFEVAKRVSR